MTTICMQLRWEVTNWEKTHMFVTSGFFEMDNPDSI